jgi:hypothetical protein
MNRSHAVAERNDAIGDKVGDWPTPPWVTRALFEEVIFPSLAPGARTAMARQAAWEPACNRGHMAKPLAEYFGEVIATDLIDYGWEGQHEAVDFLPVMGASALPQKFRRFRDRLYAGDRPLDFIATNPPFPLWEQFAQRCIELRPMTGFALLGRLGALTGMERYRTLFAKCPPSTVAVFTERCSLVPGGLDPQADQPHLYAWFVWLNGCDAKRHTRLAWIPPCRHRLDRKDDWTGALPLSRTEPAAEAGT